MPIVADAAVAIRGDLSKFSGDLKKAEAQTQSLGQKLSAALSPKALVGGLAGGFAAVQVLGFLGDAISAASNLGETVSKTSQILGEEALPGLEKWAEGAAQAFGQSKQQALDGAASFAIFGKSAGLAGQDLVGFSTDMSELSSDFASFFNTSPEEAIQAIGAALRGESEPIRKYGILLDEATLRQRAMKLGIIQTTTQALTPQQRVLAAQAEILAQSSDAQGDFARTSDGLANQQRILAAEFANVQVELGEVLLPVMLKLANFAIDVLVPALTEIIKVVTFIPDVLAAAGDEVRKFLNIPAEQEGLGLDEVVAGWMDAIIGRDFGTALQGGLTVTEDWVHNMGGTLAGGATEVAAGAEKGITDPIEEAAKDAREKAIAEIKATPGDLAQALIDGQADVESGMTALTDLMAESLSDPAKIAYYEGVLTSEQLAAGLNDKRADVRAKALAVKEDAEEQLRLLKTGAADAAVDAGTTFAYQLGLKSDAAKLEAAKVANAARVALIFDAGPGGTAIGKAWIGGLTGAINGALTGTGGVKWSVTKVKNLLGGSLPTEGPLKGKAAERGGLSIGEAWGMGIVEAIRFSLGLVSRSLSLPQWASWATPLRPVAAPMAAGMNPVSGQVINNTWNLTINGVRYAFRSRDDFIKALDDLGSFGGQDPRMGTNG